MGKNTSAIEIFAVFAVSAITIYTMIVGRSLILPLISGIVLWYIIIRFTSFFERLPFLNVQLPYSFALFLALVLACILLYAFFMLLAHSIGNIINEAPLYQKKLISAVNWINEQTSANINVNKLLSKINFTQLFSQAAVTLSSLAGNLVLILIYALFLLMEYKSFHLKLKNICGTKEKYKRVSETIKRISRDINTYLKVKTSVSLLTGTLSFLVLTIFGVKYAEFWGLIIFIFDFIPTIGTIAAIVLTVLAVSIQFTSLSLLLLLAVLLSTIQFVDGNIIEPRFMGAHLNLSPVVIIISLAFWGTIWGVLGMLLCIPLMTIINIILSKFKATRSVAILLSADGQVITE